MRFSSPFVSALNFVADREVAIAPQKFCELAISHRPLVRVNDETVGLRGLFDRQTGELFLVEADELQRWLDSERCLSAANRGDVMETCG